jgi:hypothetical protein
MRSDRHKLKETGFGQALDDISFRIAIGTCIFAHVSLCASVDVFVDIASIKR